MRDLKAEGMTMLLATHEMGFARESRRRSASSTRASCARTPERIFADPQNDRTRNFLKRIIEAGRL